MGTRGQRNARVIGVARHSETKELLEVVSGDGSVPVLRHAPRADSTWLDDADGELGRAGLRGTWNHFKGGTYWFLGRAVEQGTEEPFVVYLDGRRDVWARPDGMVSDRVDRDGYTGPRFWPADPDLSD